MNAQPAFAPDLGSPSLEREALSALGARMAAVDASSGRVVWRTSGFADAFPGLLSVYALRKDVSGLAEAVAEARDGGATVSAVVSTQDGRRVFDTRVAPSEDRSLLYLELDDAGEREAAQRRRLEDRERLLLTSRVLSVGEMASMLAHELNQPIGSIVNLLRGLKARLERGVLTADAGRAAIEKATDQALYASGVIARIRTFVDQRQPKVEPLDLARLTSGTLELLDWEIRRDRVEARAVLAPALPPVLGDAVMIQQVLVNLCRNGLEAMRGQGPGDRRLTLKIAPAGEEVELTIADTGPGVSEEAAARLFQPFSSTKSDGMGVGLSVCRSIVELHGGRLWFTRNPDGGSTFHLALPETRPEPS